MPAPRLHDEQGFSLVELLVALTIFAIGMLGIAGLQITSISQNSGSNTRSLSIALAQRVVEEVMSLDDLSPIFRSDSANVVWDLDPETAANTEVVPGGGTYSATTSILTDNPADRIARVTVTIDGPLDADGLPIPRIARQTSLTCFKRFVRP